MPTPSNKSFLRPSSMPATLSDMIAAEWTEVYQSPFGNSLYSMPGKTWDHTPMGCLRVADHWNFANKKHPVPPGQTSHCPSDRPVGEGWAIGRWNGSVFVILQEFPRVKKRRVRVIELACMASRRELLSKLIDLKAA